MDVKPRSLIWARLGQISNSKICKTSYILFQYVKNVKHKKNRKPKRNRKTRNGKNKKNKRTKGTRNNKEELEELEIEIINKTIANIP